MQLYRLLLILAMPNTGEKAALLGQWGQWQHRSLTVQAGYTHSCVVMMMVIVM
jgi:hypothetical protein